MNKIENYLGVANHDIQMANNSRELKSYVASILYENNELQQENQKYKEVIDKIEKYCYKFGECTPRLSEVIDILKEVSE